MVPLRVETSRSPSSGEMCSRRSLAHLGAVAGWLQFFQEQLPPSGRAAQMLRLARKVDLGASLWCKENKPAGPAKRSTGTMMIGFHSREGQKRSVRVVADDKKRAGEGERERERESGRKKASDN